MKHLFADANFGLLGLLWCFTIFAFIALRAYWPSRRAQTEAHKFIPLNEDTDGQ